MNRKLLIATILLGAVIVATGSLWGTIAFVAGVGIAAATKRDITITV